MADTKDRMKNGIDAAADFGKKAADTGAGVINRVADGATQVAEMAQDKFRSVVGAVEDNAQAVADRVSSSARQGVEAVEHAGERVQEYGQDVVDLVKKNPIPALLIAFGAGFVLSQACRRS